MSDGQLGNRTIVATDRLHIRGPTDAITHSAVRTRAVDPSPTPTTPDAAATLRVRASRVERRHRHADRASCLLGAAKGMTLGDGIGLQEAVDEFAATRGNLWMPSPSRPLCLGASLSSGRWIG